MKPFVKDKGLNMNNFREIMDRLRQYYDVKSDKKVAEKLGINYNTVKTWSGRKTIPIKTLLNSIQNESIDTNWLLYGSKGTEKTSQIINGDNNISFSGSGNTVSDVQSSYNVKPESNYTDEIKEICELLQEYGSPKMIKDLKEKLLQIKELHG